jgi:DNA primase
MARIPDEEIERLKTQISLERLATAKGVKLKQHGGNLIGLCPFHDDREPSLVITPEKNLWHCLGACQAGGTVIDWVMRAEGVRFRHAVELLRADRPSLEAFSEKPRGRQQGRVAKHSTIPKLPVLLERSAADEVLLGQVVDYYHETLKQSPEALAYFEKRGLRSHEMIERFRLGFANRTLAYRLPQKTRKPGAELRGRMQALGILRESGHEHLNGSLVIPVFDEQGRVTELYGRKINDHLREGTPKHLYLPGPHRGVWNAEALTSSREIILCESLIDALTFWCAGFRNVTASYGVEGFTDDHREAFRKHGIERVLIAYDRDDAGESAAEKLAKELAAMGIEVMRVLFPKGMDANEYALKVLPAERSLGLALRQAQWIAGVRKGGGLVARHDAQPVIENEAAVETASGRESLLSLDGEPPSKEATDKTLSEVALREASSMMEMPLNAPRPDHEPSAALPGREVPAKRMTAREAARFADELGAELADNAAPPAAAPRSATSASSSDEVVFQFGDRRWRVRGMPNKPLPGSLRVNVLCARDSGVFHVDTLELYSARQRALYTKLASEELGVEERVVKRDLGEVLLKLEEFLDHQQKEGERAQKRELTDTERDAALELLCDPKLLARILEDFERCGVVGEETNKLVGYLAATSRKLAEPLAVVIQSSSAAGKSSLMDAVLELMPEEERVQYSAMTGQSLFYMGETNLQNKILAIVEEQGAERASYALKLLQSEGELTIASTGKDPATGRLITQEYHVEGPVMIFQTTTAVDMDEELLNRCIVLTVDEGRDQTRAIHQRQRQARTLEGVIARQERQRILALHQNAQRLIRPLFVVNPYAGELRFPDHQTRMRRDHTKYLGLMEAVALLHQYQRPVKTVEHRGQKLRYIEVTREDIRAANRLAHEVLGRTLDELPPQTRRLLGLLDEMAKAECERLGIDRCDFRFSRREVRDRTGWGDTQLKVHLGRLVEMEYVIAHRAGGHSQRLGYELAYAQSDGDGPFLPGLISADELRGHDYDPNRSGSEASRSGQNVDQSGSGRRLVGVQSGGGRISETGANQQKTSFDRDRSEPKRPKTHPGNGSSEHVVAMSSAAAPATAVS